MAMFSTLSLLLSLLFVSCSIDNICSCTSTAVQMPSTVNARAAVIQYWKLKLGTNKAPPRILLSKLSTLSPCQLNSMNLHNIREMIIDEAKEEEAAAAVANSGDAESSNHIEMVTSEEKAEEEVGRNSHASVQYAPSSIKNKYSHASAAISNGDFSDKDKIVASEKNTENDNHVAAIYSSNGSYITAIYDGAYSNNYKIVTSEKNKNDDHATAIYSSNGTYITAIYDGEFSDNGKIVTGKQNTKSNNHVAAIYSSNGSYITAIYDGAYSNNYKIVTSEKNKNDDHATAIYSPNGTYITAIYDGEFSDNGKIATEKQNTKSNNHVAAIYSSNGSYITAIYDGAYSNNYKIVTSEKNKNDDHATVIYNSNGTYVTAIYDGEFSDNGTVTIERNKEKQAANTYNSEDNHVGVAHHTHESNVDIDNTFFRESNLNKGKVMPMPHFKDKMPLFHFLPKSIATKIPFSVTAIRDIFQIPANTTMGKAVEQNVAACKMPPNKDEMKQCVSAAEDMIDFVTFGLGSNNIVVKSMENSNGSGSRVLIGDAKVVNMNNGEFTRTLICHQEDFPYMLHHCHTVPKTRLYEVEILDAETKQKINSGTAICHIDTSTWGSKHTAFAMLESLPGKTEVCHWILPWEMAWTIAPTA